MVVNVFARWGSGPTVGAWAGQGETGCGGAL